MKSKKGRVKNWREWKFLELHQKRNFREWTQAHKFLVIKAFLSSLSAFSHIVHCRYCKRRKKHKEWGNKVIITQEFLNSFTLESFQRSKSMFTLNRWHDFFITFKLDVQCDFSFLFHLSLLTFPIVKSEMWNVNFFVCF